MCISAGIYLFVLGTTTGGIQGLLKALSSGILLGRTQKDNNGVLGIGPRSGACKTSTLFLVLSVWLPTYCLSI